MRNQRLDMIKGFAIIAMVLGHSGFPFTPFLYLFHMAIFFMASGYCFRGKYSCDVKSVRAFILRRLKGLYVPYLFWTILFLLCHNLFLKINIYTNNPLISEYVSAEYVVLKEALSIQGLFRGFIYALGMRCNTQLGGTFWFFYTLLIISIGYCVIDFFIKLMFRANAATFVQFIIAVIFLGVGYWFNLYQISLHGMNLFLSYYSLFYLGNLLKRCEQERVAKRYLLPIFILSLMILLLLYLRGVRIGLGSNDYVNPGVLLMASVSGWYLLKATSMMLEKYRCEKAMNFIAYVGKNSLCIMVLHFLCFKPINLLMMHIWNLPSCALAAFPVLTNKGPWWILYTLSGILMPLFIKKILAGLLIRTGCEQIRSIHLL